MLDDESVSKTTQTVNKKKRKRSKAKHKISFDKETVTKTTAEKLVSENKSVTLNYDLPTQSKKQKQKNTNNKDAVVDANPTKIISPQNGNRPRRKKKSKETQLQHSTDTGGKTTSIGEEPSEPSTDVADIEEPNVDSPTKATEESKRAKKRQKHLKLITEKKLKGELAQQQKCLNYLSQWKHNRKEWKFEKLRQVWLQQHMFDSDRVPESFWDTLVEYLSNSKGQARKSIIDDAIKVIEAAQTQPDKPEEEESDSDENSRGDSEQSKLNRATSIVQHMQE